MGDGLGIDEGQSTAPYKVLCIVLHSFEKSDFGSLIRSGIRTCHLVRIKYRNLAYGERLGIHTNLAS